MSFQAYLDSIKAKTGKTPDDFRVLAAEEGLTQYGEIMAWLKSDFGLGHGHANAIAQLLVHPEARNVEPDDRVAKLFAGNKAKWRQPYDTLLAELLGFGTDVATAPTNTYISLLRGSKKFGIVQHVRNILKQNGRAAIVVPDNVLFEGGAGETVRRRLLQDCDVHTLLRLPTGIFYAQGVKANVLFFDRKPASATPWTERLWIYDLRTNMDFTLKTRPLARSDLDDFVACYNPANRHARKATWSEANVVGRWRSFGYDELLARDKVNLDISWLRDDSLEDSANLPEPDVLASEIMEDLQAALEQFRAIAEDLAV